MMGSRACAGENDNRRDGESDLWRVEIVPDVEPANDDADVSFDVIFDSEDRARICRDGFRVVKGEKP